MVQFLFLREHNISDVDSSFALQTLVAMETLNISEGSGDRMKNLICCPVRNERSKDVIGRCCFIGIRHSILFIKLSTHRDNYPL